MSPTRLIAALILSTCLMTVAGVSLWADTSAIQSSSPLPDVKLSLPIPGIEKDLRQCQGDTSGRVECLPLCTRNNGGSLSCEGLAKYISAAYSWLIVAATIFCVIMIMIGGLQYLTAGGSGKVQDAQKRIKDALFGLVLLLGSYLLLWLLNPALVNLPALQLMTAARVPVDIPKENIVFTSGGGAGGGTSNISSNITTHDAALLAAAQASGIDCNLLKAFMFAESNGNPRATSPVGARGLLQLMPDTARGLGFDPGQLFDPVTSTRAGATYIKQLTQRACNGSTSNTVCRSSDLKYVIASYNGGPGANTPSKSCPGKTYWECEINDGYAETRTYVGRVLGNYKKITDQNWGCSPR